MARWICLCFILFIFLFNDITMMLIPDQRVLFKRHIGLARQKLYRVKPLSNQDNIFQRQHQTLPSPDVLRDRWIDLFNEQNKIFEPLVIEDN